jgi:hypothetical protein
MKRPQLAGSNLQSNLTRECLTHGEYGSQDDVAACASHDNTKIKL